MKIGDYCWKEFGKCECLSDENLIRAKNSPDEPGIQCTFCMMDEIFITNKQGNDPAVDAFGRIWDTFWVPLTDGEYLHYAIDITEKKQAEEALIESNKTKDKFFSIIAHDLRSPFNALLGLSKVLYENHKKYDETKREHIIKSVNDSAERTFNLLENLLTWSHSQSGTIDFLPKKLNIKTLFSETMLELQGQANEKNIQVSDAISKNDLIYADKNMIATVLRNLISNAIKYTHTNGEINISAEHGESNVIISVTDTGVGIEKEKLRKIFDIGEISSTSGTENEKGTGLGLVLCKEFVEKHNGEIWVESEEGEGSKFIFSIPNICN